MGRIEFENESDKFLPAPAGQATSGDRAAGIPGIGHGERFADMRARSKAFDEARVRKARRAKKDRKTIQASDFAVGDLLDVVYHSPNGHELPGQAIVEDVNPLRKDWRQDGTVYVRWVTQGTDHFDHLFKLDIAHSGYWFRGVVRWVRG